MLYLRRVLQPAMGKHDVNHKRKYITMSYHKVEMDLDTAKGKMHKNSVNNEDRSFSQRDATLARY